VKKQFCTTLSTDAVAAGSVLPWVDLAKGICILLVVLMHTVLGIQKDIGQGGFLLNVVAWTKPFRMPDFFMLSGFLAAGIGALNWRDFVDRRILHYAYFYLLWLAIVVCLKSLASGSDAIAQIIVGIAGGIFEPFSTLWFIYVLPFFMLGARLANGRAIFVVIILAIVLHIQAASYPAGSVFAMASEWTSSTAFNSFAMFFVYFLAGYFGRSAIIKITEWANRAKNRAVVLLFAWGIFHSAALQWGITDTPGLTLIFGVAGGLAVSVVCAIVVRLHFLSPLAYCGRHSLAIYLAFVLPMAAVREVLVGTAVGAYPDLLALIVLSAAVLIPLALEYVTTRGFFEFLFRRPRWARLSGWRPS